jgi:hypothetical protein
LASDIPAGDGNVANLFFSGGGIRREATLHDVYEQKDDRHENSILKTKPIEENKSYELTMSHPRKVLNFEQIIKDMWKTGELC